MPIQILKSKNAEFSLRYRAICLSGDYRGNWKADKSTALNDALRHQQKHNHQVDIEVEQKQLIRFSSEDITR